MARACDLATRRWDDFVELACDEIRLYGEGPLSLARRLRAMLLDLRATACEERRSASTAS